MIAIYKITNRLNGKPYVGQTSQPPEKRFLQHSKAKSLLGQAMRQCGFENFTIEVIEECSTPEQTKEREMFWIRVLKSKAPNGYNQSDGGESCTPKPRRKEILGITPQAYSTSRMTIGESFKRFRSSLKLSQKKFAESLGIPCQSYQSYEYNNSVPSANVIIKMADKYNVSMDYLLGRSDKPQPTNFDEREVKAAFALRDMIGEAALKKFMTQTQSAAS